MSMNKYPLSFVWAEDLTGGIGYQGQLPWHFPADLAHFKTVTMGKTIVMGGRTWRAIGRALPGRTSVVLTRQPLTVPGVMVVHDEAQLHQVIAERRQLEPVAIIGGATLFALLQAQVDVLERTVIEATYPSDTKMPKLDEQAWTLVNQTTLIEHGVKLRFETWHRLDVEQN